MIQANTDSLITIIDRTKPVFVDENLTVGYIDLLNHMTNAWQYYSNVLATI